MKKLTTIVLAACLVLGLALPATADVDVKISGELRADGVYNDNQNLLENGKVSLAYYKSRFRVQPVIMVNDNISITARFDALERNWGTSDESAPATTGSDDNIDFDLAYATLKTPVGGFLFGRMNGNAWGLKWLDDIGPRDRIVYVLPIDKLIFAAVIEKFAENDGTSLTQSDNDLDKYYLTATLKEDNFTAGFLYGYYDYKQFQDLYQSTAAPATLGAMAAGGAPFTTGGVAHVLSPYFNGKFGPLGVMAEASYAFADAKYDSPWWTSASGAPAANAAGSDSKKVDILSYVVDLNYEMGPFSFGGGYARAQGDADFNDDKFTAQGVFSAGTDWEKTLILFSNEIGMHNAIDGGTGTPVGSTVTASYYGYQVFFVQGDYDVTESINLGAVYASSKADDVPATWDDKHGSEVNLKATWKFLDNVTWTGIAAFLNAGDFYKNGNPAANIADTYSLFTRIKVNF